MRLFVYIHTALSYRVRTRMCNTCIHVYIRRPLFSHGHQLSIVGDKDYEIARQIYLYGGDLGSIRKNDSTVGVVSLVA